MFKKLLAPRLNETWVSGELRFCCMGGRFYKGNVSIGGDVSIGGSATDLGQESCIIIF